MTILADSIFLMAPPMRRRGWRLLTICCIISFSGDLIQAASVQSGSDIGILKNLYHATNGPGWKNDKNWLDNTNFCGWYGITCSGTSVIKIILPDNNMNGTVPAEIFQLPMITSINFNRNINLRLSDGGVGAGGKTGLGFATQLQSLFLEQTGVGGVSFPALALDGIQSLDSLEHLILSNTDFRGASVPRLIFQPPNLKTLQISNCNFTGTLLNLQNGGTVGIALQTLDCSMNSLTGQIPSISLGHWTELVTLNLSDNLFTGTLPAALSQLTNLERLYIERTRRTVFPVTSNATAVSTARSATYHSGITGSLPDFGSLSNIRELALGQNSLGGRLQSTFLNGVTDPTRQVRVDLSSNFIYGSVPSQLASRFDKLFIDMTNNRLLGALNNAAICSKSQWMNNDVASFGCYAILCPRGTFNVLGRQNTTLNSCIPCGSNQVAPFMGSRSCSIVASVQQARKLQEREALVELYDATDGSNWSRQDNWLNYTADPCSWFGMNCSSAGTGLVVGSMSDMAKPGQFVTQIYLPNNNLNGVIPSSTFEIPSLQAIDLGENKVDVQWEALGTTSTLTQLRLDSTSVSSLKGISVFPQLTSLKASFANLTGSIPDELMELTYLQHLSLGHNDLTGMISYKVENLSNLNYLALNDNWLTGTIPVSIGRLRNLGALTVAENDLTGTLPSSIGDLHNLHSLSLHHLNMEGAGLSGKLIDFSTNYALRSISLSGNSFTGSIPDSFLQGTAASSETIELDLRWNYLNGTIPATLTRFKQLDVWLTGNLFTQFPSSLCSQYQWMNGNVAKFGCDAIACPIGTYNNLGRQDNSASPCQSCPKSATAEYLGSMKCLSTRSSDEKVVLQQFYQESNGKGWTRSDNWLNDTIDVCNWFGITCAASTLGTVGFIEGINLSNNGLQGTVPTELLTLQSLSLLDVSHNKVEFLFSGVKNATNLVNLNLDATATTSIEGISMASSLEQLHLSKNQFYGASIPSELFELTNLKQVYLSQSGFGGALPNDMQKMANLEILDFTGNRLTGKIPDSIGSLTNLTQLILTGNNFSGTLPTTINQLANLRIFYLNGNTLDGNGLSGQLLDFSGLQELTDLHLSSNSFTGTIPSSFLSGIVNATSSIRVDLRWNQLTGSLPIELTSLNSVEIYLCGNYLSAIDSQFCGKKLWMQGAVGKFGCDAIMCPKGMYNNLGRQALQLTPCVACQVAKPSLYLGSTSCVAGTGDQTSANTLEKIYEATGGSDWIQKGNWLNSSVHFCEWYGINCTGSTIVSIDLEGNGLYGTMPQDVFNLPGLKSLALGKNSIEVDLYGIPNTSLLESLSLQATGISSLSGISGGKHLQKLHLEQNALCGSIADEIYRLSSLKELHLFDNSFTGTLSSAIGQWKQLEVLFANGNTLTGHLPDSLGTLSNLQLLSLADNSFSGTLPNSLLNLKSLRELSLRNQNDKGGNGLSGKLIDFSSSPSMSTLDLAFNGFTGTIPSSILGASLVTSLVTLDLTSNLITGLIPTTLQKFDKLNVFLGDNLVKSIAGSFCAKTNWMNGAVNDFGCDAILCPVGTYNLDGRRDRAADSCLPCNGSDASVYLGSTTCPTVERQKEREILGSFYQSCNGTKWRRKDNWQQSGSEVCDWYGIGCNDDGYVVSIELGANNVAGAAPAMLFELQHLGKLDLNANPLAFTFAGINTAKNLSFVRLDSMGLVSLEGIGGAGNLRELYCDFNNIQSVPNNEIAQLRDLQVLSLSDNEISGSIPTSLQRLLRLTTLRLGSNKFSGHLPDFSGLHNLTLLDFSNNEFTGTIPSSLLGGIDSSHTVMVDVSLNNITGSVPSELQRLTYVNIFLRGNRISDMSPTLCAMSNWNNGDVSTYGCNGILCPPRTYNAIGRQSTNDTPCISCGNAEFFGSIECPLQKETSSAERRVYMTASLTVLIGALFASSTGLSCII